MAITINAKTSGAGGLETTADNTGNINIQSGGSTVMSISSTGVSVTGSFSQDGAVYSTQPSFRNIIINGNMQIAQRGTSSTGQTAGGYLTVDRWKFNIATAGTWTMTQDSDVPTGQGFANSMKMSCTTADASLAAGDRVWFDQRVEGYNLQQLAYGTASAKSITVSFWVKSNKTGTYILEFYSDDSNRTASKSYTISSANTWEKKTITLAGDTVSGFNNDNNLSLYVWFWLAAGSTYSSGTLNTSWNGVTTANRAVGQVNLADSTSNYINITGIQLEVGSGASDFEFLPYDVQLARCYRYYYKVQANQQYANFAIGRSFSVNEGTCAFWLPVSMRATPTFSSSAASNFTYSITAVNGVAQTMQDNRVMTIYTSSSSGFTAGGAYCIESGPGTGSTVYMAWSSEL